MTNDQNARVTAIRSRTQKERALISELNTQLDVELSKMLELASSLLDDVEDFFSMLNSCKNRDPASPWRGCSDIPRRRSGAWSRFENTSKTLLRNLV